MDDRERRFGKRTREPRPERRSAPAADSPSASGDARSDRQRGRIRFDDKGNASWQWRVDDLRIREEDPTVNLLRGLDENDLRLDDTEPQGGSPGDGFDPYDKRR